MGTAPNSSRSEANAPRWAITRQSLLSDDTNAQEWSAYAHSPVTMTFLAQKYGAQVVGDLRFTAAQASALMVVAADRVCRIGVTDAWLRPLRNIIVNLKEEL